MRTSWMAVGAATILAMSGLGPARAAPPYKVGQVWSYDTRAQDSGSLLKIGAVEDEGAIGLVYHISLIGVRFGPDHRVTVVGHLPVSQSTLDTSVTELTPSDAIFPDPSQGITEWRAAHGGVFTIPIKEIIAAVDHMTPAPSSSPSSSLSSGAR